jgi:hypothetical protein
VARRLGDWTAVSAAAEECLLGGCGEAPENNVSVRKAPEPLDYVGVPLGIACKPFIPVGPRECNAAFLVRQMLRMHERQIKELPLQMAYLLIVSSRNGAIRDRTREPFVGSGLMPESKHLVGFDLRVRRECAHNLISAVVIRL